MKNRKTADDGGKLGRARDAIFQSDKHPRVYRSLSLVISARFLVAKSRLSRARAPKRRGVATRKKERKEREIERKKSNNNRGTVLESTRVRRLFVMRHGSPFLHEVRSVYALIQLDESKKIVQTTFQRRQPLLYPFSALFVHPPPFSDAPLITRAVFAREFAVTRKLVIKPEL